MSAPVHQVNNCLQPAARCVTYTIALRPDATIRHLFSSGCTKSQSAGSGHAEPLENAAAVDANRSKDNDRAAAVSPLRRDTAKRPVAQRHLCVHCQGFHAEPGDRPPAYGSVVETPARFFLPSVGAAPYKRVHERVLLPIEVRPGLPLSRAWPRRGTSSCVPEVRLA